MIFARINASGRQFPQTPSGSITILAFQQHHWLAHGIIQRQHDDGTRMPDHVTPCANVAWFFNFIGIDAEYRPAKSSFGRNHANQWAGLLASRRHGSILASIKPSAFSTKYSSSPTTSISLRMPIPIQL